MAFHKTADQLHAIRQLQLAYQKVAAGDTAVTDIAIAGVGLKDQITSVIMFAAGVPSDVTSEASVTSAGNIQLSTTDSSGNTLLVTIAPFTGSGA